jgi:hypothetical protein
MPRAKISFERRICRFAASVSSRSDLECMACSQGQCTKYSVDVNKYQGYGTLKLSATWAVRGAKPLWAFRSGHCSYSQGVEKSSSLRMANGVLFHAYDTKLFAGLLSKSKTVFCKTGRTARGSALGQPAGSLTESNRPRTLGSLPKGSAGVLL